MVRRGHKVRRELQEHRAHRAQRVAVRKAHKELTSFLKRPDVDDQVIQEGMDLADVSEIMAR